MMVVYQALTFAIITRKKYHNLKRFEGFPKEYLCLFLVYFFGINIDYTQMWKAGKLGTRISETAGRQAVVDKGVL